MGGSAVEFVERASALLTDAAGLPPSHIRVLAWLIVCGPALQAAEDLCGVLGLSPRRDHFLDSVTDVTNLYVDPERRRELLNAASRADEIPRNSNSRPSVSGRFARCPRPAR